MGRHSQEQKCRPNLRGFPRSRTSDLCEGSSELSKLARVNLATLCWPRKVDKRRHLPGFIAFSVTHLYSKTIPDIYLLFNMRFNPLLVLFVGLGAALTYKRDPRRSDAVSDSTLSAPPGAPADFVTSFEFLDHEVAEDVANLQPVTQETSAKRRALRALKRQDPGDFYECTNTVCFPLLISEHRF